LFVLFKLGVVRVRASARNGPAPTAASNQECAACCIMAWSYLFLPLQIVNPGESRMTPRTGVNNMQFFRNNVIGQDGFFAEDGAHHQRRFRMWEAGESKYCGRQTEVKMTRWAEKFGVNGG